MPPSEVRSARGVRRAGEPAPCMLGRGRRSEAAVAWDAWVACSAAAAGRQQGHPPLATRARHASRLALSRQTHTAPQTPLPAARYTPPPWRQAGTPSPASSRGPAVGRRGSAARWRCAIRAFGVFPDRVERRRQRRDSGHSSRRTPAAHTGCDRAGLHVAGADGVPCCPPQCLARHLRAPKKTGCTAPDHHSEPGCPPGSACQPPCCLVPPCPPPPCPLAGRRTWNGMPLK